MIEITIAEAGIVLTALREMVAQPSEFPITNTPAFEDLITKVYNAVRDADGRQY